MATTKHTPAPWTINSGKNAIKITGGNDNNGYYFIAALGSGLKSEDEANARLIAAAPELLEAAMTAANDFLSRVNGEPSDQNHWYWGLRRAIAKAKGKVN